MPELYPEDQARVEKYLSADIHQVKRKPFRPLLLLSLLLVVLTGLSLFSLAIARHHGVI